MHNKSGRKQLRALPLPSGRRGGSDNYVSIYQYNFLRCTVAVD